MDRISFTIFIPDKKRFHITPNWIIGGLWLLTILILYLFDNAIPANSTPRLIWLTFIGVITLFFLVASHGMYQPLNGVLRGRIIFEKDSFKINNETFELKNISKFDLLLGDYYEQRSLFGRDFNPKISQGVRNYITFADSRGEVHLVYFKMEGEHSYISLSTFISAAVNAGKMHIYRAED